MDPIKLRQAKSKIDSTFALTVLIQKRCQELVSGARPLVGGEFKSPIDVALQEIIDDKIWLDGYGSDAQVAYAEKALQTEAS